MGINLADLLGRLGRGALRRDMGKSCNRGVLYGVAARLVWLAELRGLRRRVADVDSLCIVVLFSSGGMWNCTECVYHFLSSGSPDLESFKFSNYQITKLPNFVSLNPGILGFLNFQIVRSLYL